MAQCCETFLSVLQRLWCISICDFFYLRPVYILKVTFSEHFFIVILLFFLNKILLNIYIKCLFIYRYVAASLKTILIEFGIFPGPLCGRTLGFRVIWSLEVVDVGWKLRRWRNGKWIFRKNGFTKCHYYWFLAIMSIVINKWS